MTDKEQRAEKVNELIKVIADCGRQFFYSKSQDRYARIELDQRGRVWWNDDYSGERIYTHYRYWEKGFTHGGTLRSLVNNFRDYITKGTQLPTSALGPWPEWYCEGDLWGYGEDMQKVRDAASRLKLVAH